MIENCSYNDKLISWTFNDKKIEIQNNMHIKSAIYNEHRVLVMCAENKVEQLLLFNECGELQNEVSSSDVLFIMYLQQHPKFGLCAVCSAKSGEGQWQDAYYSFDENGTFGKCTTFR